MRVIAPALRTRPAEGLPHVFSDGSLCLNLASDWNRAMLVADTTVPWAAEWLYFYELWLPEGQWYGGGEWPPPRPEHRKRPMSSSTSTAS